MFAFLKAIGLAPMEWDEARAATGKTTPYVGEILDKAFETAQAIVVLFSPDDEARLRDEFHEPNDPPHETNLTPQARPNVLFEAGMAMGREPDRTIMVEIGTLRPFSDAGGRHILKMDGSIQRRQELISRLKTAMCPVNSTGTDWQTTGDFSISPKGVSTRVVAINGSVEAFLKITMNGNVELHVENKSENEVRNVCVKIKPYKDDDEIALCTIDGDTIESLKPGEEFLPYTMQFSAGSGSSVNVTVDWENSDGSKGNLHKKLSRYRK
jgi:hypothetical protein